MSLHHLLGGNFLEPTWPTGVMPIDFVLQLVSRENDLLSVDDDHVIANVEERRIRCFVLSHQQAGSDSRQPTHGLAVGVDDEPVAGLLKILPARNECLHDANLQISRKEKEQKGYEMANWVVKAIEMDRDTSSLIRVLPQKGRAPLAGSLIIPSQVVFSIIHQRRAL